MNKTTIATSPFKLHASFAIFPQTFHKRYISNIYSPAGGVSSFCFSAEHNIAHTFMAALMAKSDDTGFVCPTSVNAFLNEHSHWEHKFSSISCKGPPAYGQLSSPYSELNSGSTVLLSCLKDQEPHSTSSPTLC